MHDRRLILRAACEPGDTLPLEAEAARARDQITRVHVATDAVADHRGGQALE